VNLDPIDVSRLEIPTQLPDLRRDIHVFVHYVRQRQVKRNHRDNCLNKADLRRLSQLMSDRRPGSEDDLSPWVHFVDDIALQLGFVEYDTTGEYAGYTSVNASFPDNYIRFREEQYQRFCSSKVARQELTLLELLLNSSQENNSEFFVQWPFGRLDGFSSWGSALGVVPGLDFGAARRTLLGWLAKCPPGQWLSTASLVAHLKEHDRYFLIPKKPQYKTPRDVQGGRYGNFHESANNWGHEIDIAENEKDAFERVEGRYVERFLEGIPLLLRYVDVAYGQRPDRKLYPSLGVLQAFRVHERLGRALTAKIAEPQVTVTPDFDIYVHAEFYPAGVLDQLTPLCELVSEDTSIVLKLRKQTVAAACAADPALDVPGLLRRLSDRDLPANVARELNEWTLHSDKFVLYANACVLEADPELGVADRYTVARPSPGIRVVHSPDKLFAELERSELLPLRVRHGEKAWSRLPRNSRTRFPKGPEASGKARKPKARVKLLRVTRVQLQCPDREFLDALRRVLTEANCPVETNAESFTLSYSKLCEPQVSQAVRALRKDYQITIEDADQGIAKE
jgi:hypothetical protein